MSSARRIGETLSGQATLLGELTTQYISPKLDQLGVSLSSFELLSAIRSTGEAPQAEVARRLGIAPPSLTEAARAAAKAGLVEQVPLATDARSKQLRLTEQGERVLQQIIQTVSEAERVLARDIDPQELRKAVQVLKLANRNLAKSIQI